MKHLLFASVAFGHLLAVFACVSRSYSERFNPQLWLNTLRNSTGNADVSSEAQSLGPFRLVRFGEGQTPLRITEGELVELLKTGQRFMDVTDQDLEAIYAAKVANGEVSIAAIPTTPTHQTQVRAVIATLSQSNLVTFLSELTAYNTRYYQSSTGASAANTVYNRLVAWAAAAPGTGGAVTVSKYTHTWTMPSVIAKIAGTSACTEVVIAGAHLDSINQSSPSSGRSPGADDNGSGSVNLLEAFRALVASGFAPTCPVEFHWYSGEEAGLLGSQAIARSYSSAGRTVRSMMNLDMTAWLQTGTTPQIGWVTDRTNAALNTFGKTLVSTYLSGVVATNDYCGYACSDHASWYALGYPTTYPFESITAYENPNIHTSSDTTSSSQFSFSHMHEFSKLLVAYAIEVAA